MWPDRLRHRWGAAIAAVLVVAAAYLVSAPNGASQVTRVEQQLTEVQQRTSRLRELESKGTVSHTFMRRADLRAHYEAMFLEENPAEDIEISQSILEVLGYIEPGVDIFQVLLNVLGEEVLGFYDRKEKSVYVIADQDRLRPTDLLTLAHEFTHALQDEHFDLRKGFDDRKDNNDRTLAYQAIAEGDAVLLQSLYSLRHLTESERNAMSTSPEVRSAASAIESAPLVLRRELYFPYEEGASFMVRFYLEGSWAAVNSVWANPPESTEQILHPEKYLAGERPVEVTLPDLSATMGPAWRKLTEDTLGELDFKILIEQYAGISLARRAAAGWGGDRLQLFKRDTDGALAYLTRTVWDTEEDAAEFFSAYREVARGRHGAGLQPFDPSTFLAGSARRAPDEAWGAAAGPWHHLLVRDGSSVAIITASDLSPLGAIDLLR